MSSDWRETEQQLVETFRRIGLRPTACSDWPRNNRANGEWYVKINREINVTEMARILADATR